MTTRIRNTRGDNAPTPPTRPDGRPYAFEMIFEDGTVRAYADEPADLVAELVDGYRTLISPVDRAEARTRYAVGAQVAVQAALIDEYGLDGCSQDEQALLLGSRDQPPAPAVWRAPVPLVLVSSFYQPARHLARPAAEEPGQVWWIDPGDDITLLVSLHRLDVITLHTSAAVPPASAGRGD
jgi:hypothetical protein